MFLVPRSLSEEEATENKGVGSTWVSFSSIEKARVRWLNEMAHEPDHHVYNKGVFCFFRLCSRLMVISKGHCMEC